MMLEYIALLQENKTPELLRRLLNRTFPAFFDIYAFEEELSTSFWEMDVRFREHGIKILYERFGYALAMIAEKFRVDAQGLFSLKDSSELSASFALTLSASADVPFKTHLGLNLKDGVFSYYQSDEFFEESYELFWESNPVLRNKIVEFRDNFLSKNYLHGFLDEENDDDPNLEISNKDFLHIKRVLDTGVNDDIDINKFLGATKKIYLPRIIKKFSETPSADLFAETQQKKPRRFSIFSRE